MGREYFSRPYLNTFLVGLTHFGGNGELGDVVIDTDTTLDAGVHQYSNLTIEEGATLSPAGTGDEGFLFIFVRNKLTVKGTISVKGKGAAGAAAINHQSSGLTGPTTAYTGRASGNAGNNGGYQNGGTAPDEVSWCVGGAGAGGAGAGYATDGTNVVYGGDGGVGGGAGATGGASGAGGTDTTINGQNGGNGNPTAMIKKSLQRLLAQEDILQSYGASGASGGRAPCVYDLAAGETATYYIGASGKGGNAGGLLYVEADEISIESTGIITADGDNGGDAEDSSVTGTGNVGVGGSGGGGGGGGGIVWLRARRITNNGTVSANGGTGGAGGTSAAIGTGAAGNGATGGTGATGLVLIEELEK